MSVSLASGRAADTIFALASGAGRAAVSVVRLSGGDAAPILSGLSGGLPPARQATLRRLKDAHGAPLDQALVLWMPAPRSATGEDTAELHLHGGRAVLAAVTTALLAAGARPADPGEFSRRAFLAGKLGLLEAEAIADLVESETESQRIQALRNAGGAQSRLVSGWADRLKNALAFQEALIDFPDEDLPGHVEHSLIADLTALFAELSDGIRLSERGRKLRSGLVFAITGAPNVGKSSLLNALARRDVAIVSETPGTTRDALEVPLDLGGVPVTLVDTAGLRATEDPLEAEGIRRARAHAEAADLVLHLVDATDPGEMTQSALLVANKIDLAPPPTECILGISVRTGAGLSALEILLAQHAERLTHSGATPVLTRARHAAALRDAVTSLQAALLASLPELRAEDLRQALAALGRLTGAVDTEALLDVVFGAFCIGK